ncbi:MAG: class I SAM-dependent RNA methyltransferase [Candidatus Dormibacteraeota bacterium]|nr:class I SAM-dependent RNA methyltransferase [Candidatus Dormibacteraeota bacterium]
MIVRGEAPAHGGAVIAHDEGKAVLVYYALPDELVEGVPRGRQGGLQAVRTERVLEASPDRIEARCPHFGECGGCHWQHSRYERQLALKRQVVEDVWRRAGVRLPGDTPVLGMEDPWRYRIRGEFEASYRPGQPLQFGFHRQRSHSVLPVQTCPIHDERIERAMLAFRQAASEMGVLGIKTLLLTVEPTGKGLLWRMRRQGPGGAELEAALGARVAELLPDLVLLEQSMSLEFWDFAFRVRSDTFVQTNYHQMLVLYRLALEMVAAGPGDSILDLYAGIGTLGIPLARSAAYVTAIEENPAAVQLSRLNSRINRTPNFRTLPGKVETALRKVRMGDHQAAILDPPRAGCDPAAIAELLRLSPERLVYVSCEPSTHARDVTMLVRGGYRLRRVAIVDMFPQTYHVETVALLERSPR